MANKNSPRIYIGIFTRPLLFALRSSTGPKTERIDLYREATLPALLKRLIEALAEHEPQLPAKLAELDDEQFMGSRHKTRRYFAPERELLYINSPHLQRYAEQVGEHWLATNIGRAEASNIAGMVCQAAGAKREAASSFRL